ncbi:hypothetical protein TWF225_003516 [Orbilia oligospora]|uniref:Impact N-terminal domain-containing protein n=1 Tax=Orbilia oligospora TaxID=2813651 RepID=A0A7C8PJ76_ORBOL|nr:hypothetical protein TWF225_003516 [Orbilia oligospora]KAF3168376.1 hypothetical protein TWF751_007811 [Orbilia oligospora]KAF3258466.1 hypothetical protein TWF128_004709 [Orbilia oligospora]KAF3271148.1 hypothetical protein TWF217_005564 [Orbilia oligospora]KAF3282125.1 hypothetical protein TWF132_010824 [Orbilia oligospora]
MSLKRPHSPTSLASSALYVSKKIEDRASTFTAYFSPTAPQRQLQSHPDLTTASHRILAWRKPSSQKTLTGLPAYNTGSDDDGENYAGKKLLKVLDDYKVEGSIVVARWYGGQLLGPVRFQHIENAAKEAIRAYLADKDESANGESAKKTKVSNNEQGQEDEKEKEDLVEELKNRDESIAVLRNLLDDKMGKKKKSEETPDAGEESSQQRPTKEVDYKSMPLVRLKQLDKARDNTISFLLKKIDEVEEAQEKALIRSEDEDDNKDAPKT